MIDIVPDVEQKTITLTVEDENCDEQAYLAALQKWGSASGCVYDVLLFILIIFIFASIFLIEYFSYHKLYQESC
jgi:hypothetical protein